MSKDVICRRIAVCISELQIEKSDVVQYRLCNQLADHTRELLLQNDIESLKRSLRTLAHLYRKSNHSCQRAIENVYLYRIGGTLLLCTYRKEVMQALPDVFRKLIIGQIIYSGI